MSAYELPAYEMSVSDQLRAPFLWIAAKLYILAQWTLATSLATASYAISFLLLFPGWVLASLMEGAANWHRLFFSDVSWFPNAIPRFAVWLRFTSKHIYDDVVDWIVWDLIEAIVDAYVYLTSTVPSAFHDTFGNPLGDLTRKDLSDFGCTFAAIFVVAAILYAAQLCEGPDTFTPPPPPPITSHKPDHHETKANGLGSSSTPNPFELTKFEHFLTPSHFEDPLRDQSWCVRVRDGTLADLSHHQEPFINTPKEEPEEPQPPIVAATPPARQDEAPTPPQDTMNLVPSPSEPLQAPPT
jgi:hypothetical protein